MKRSFAPVVVEDAVMLVLGSLPGEASLRAGQYYAHPHNLFWKFIFTCAGVEFSTDYVRRLEVLKSLRIALWDVLLQCRREGSLDASIEEDSEHPNDIVVLLKKLPQVRKICFNGQKAFSSFKRHILKVAPELEQRYQLVVLPSTSPANASQSYQSKFTRWQSELLFCSCAPALPSRGEAG
ncbi:MAG: DNA-deoxyinosine glycosylase [Candidatus Riflebacteria bacterium HGW-Riflebacteria-2]|jgi:TDG/mug DNA glycosylase family protein|nr:MAG: DNA-deoxyinosine glycosylase [Candidatus Riflebacteria bacterium HGW-Riflebacteria-2]